ncbi:MAG TPA: S41 family peptidase [Chitinophagales bacterium]|nr:S41 family peptidase [Chitinophagales bacterium]HRH54148.1 S41 family peptidase [Chitinophagales bacterium]
MEKWIIQMFLLVVINFITSCGINAATGEPEGAINSKMSSDEKLSVVQRLKESAQLSVEEKVKLYYTLKKDSAQYYNFGNEDELNLFGYAYLWDNKIEEAIIIFKLVVAEFPASSNAYDSLGEAYLKNGNLKQAKKNYEKSLALNPDNFNAEDQIELILFPDKVKLSPTEKFKQVFLAEAYKQDLEQLGNTLLKIHPNALKFISKEKFWQAIESKKELITDSTTFGEFAWMCSEIIANVHCSHTNMGSFNFETSLLMPVQKFPLQTYWVNDKLYVVDAMNNGKSIKVRDEIISINGVNTSTFMSDIYKHIASQGYIKTTKNRMFNMWSSTLMAYAFNFPETYSVKVASSNKEIYLQPATAVEEPYFDESLTYANSVLDLELMPDNSAAYLTIASFNYYRWNDFDVFKNFIDSSFQVINKNKIDNLIIDLRFNGGGSQSASIHLLRYLLDEPFTYYSNAQFEGKQGKIEGEELIYPFENRFKGKSYFIIDGHGNSTTGHFMSIVKHFDVGTIVGEELGSNQFCSAGMTTCRLSNTKLVYYVANNTHESLAITLPDETGILPDYYINQSIDEYLQKIDVVRDFTIELVKKAK